jgi:hypothetical protein
MKDQITGGGEVEGMTKCAKCESCKGVADPNNPYKKLSYESYGDWYDNGPGSENFKRELRKNNYTQPIINWVEKCNTDFEKPKPKTKQPLEDKLFEVDI